jgi:hypothetical protein
MEHGIRAGAQQERALQRVQRHVDRARRGEGPEIQAVARSCAAMLEHLGKRVIVAQEDIRKALIVAIRDVIAGLQPLDQVGFQQQGFDF